MNRLMKLSSYLALFGFFLILGYNARSQSACGMVSYIDNAPTCPDCPQTTGTMIVKVYVHIVRKQSDGTGAQSLSAVNQALNIMMDDFSPHGIYFSLKSLDYVDVSDDLYDFSKEEKGQLFNVSGHSDGVDIYILGSNVYNAGVAQDIPGKAFAFGGTVAGAPSTATHIISHEMGHCLGLVHTFHGEIPCALNLFEDIVIDGNNYCSGFEDECDCGDYVDDTGTDPYLTFCYVSPSCEFAIPDPEEVEGTPCEDCFETFGSTPSSFDLPINNIMSASILVTTACDFEFTPGQASRMKCIINSNSQNEQVLDDIIRIGFDFTATTNKGCYEDIVVEQGGKLTINNTLTMKSGKGILVETGGYLLVNTGHLTGCLGGIWNGVTIAGNPSISQIWPYTGQGYVKFKNNAVMENAINSLTVEGGGVVVVYTSDFLNCGNALFKPYAFPSHSIFNNCNFEIDGQDYQFSSFDSHVNLQNVNSVEFHSCDFKISNLSSLPNNII